MKAVDQSQFELSGHFHHARNNTIKHEGYQQTGKEQGQQGTFQGRLFPFPVIEEQSGSRNAE